VSGLEDHNRVLGVALAQWAARDDTRPQPEARQAANTAMDAVDSMLGHLHQLRARLVAEIRASDQAAAARADALLAELRKLGRERCSCNEPGKEPECPYCGIGTGWQEAR
jgi:hypothetical protein